MTFTTQAMVMRAAGGPEVLEYRSLDLAFDPDGTNVLVRLVAAGVNPADTFFRSLGPYIGTAEGCVLGHDGAGIVQAVGRRATGFTAGDRVCFCHGGVGGAAGTYARHAVVPVECLVRVPEIVALEDAAAIALVFITGWEAMVERAGVGTGDLVLIHGGREAPDRWPPKLPAPQGHVWQRRSVRLRRPRCPWRPGLNGRSSTGNRISLRP